MLHALARTRARFVVIGGVALQLHGSSYNTFDLDIAYERTRDNAERLADALSSFAPRPRGMSPDLPFVFDAQTILASQPLTLETTAGDVDLLGEVLGIGPYAKVEDLADTTEFDGFALRVLGVDGLISAKRAAARPKDEPGLIELEALREAPRLNEIDGRPT